MLQTLLAEHFRFIVGLACSGVGRQVLQVQFRVILEVIPHPFLIIWGWTTCHDDAGMIRTLEAIMDGWIIWIDEVIDGLIAQYSNIEQSVHAQ